MHIIDKKRIFKNCFKNPSITLYLLLKVFLKSLFQLEPSDSDPEAALDL